MGFERFHSKFGVISDVAHHGPALTKDPKVTLEFRAIFKGMVKLSLKLLESEYDAQVYQDLCEIMAKVEEDYGAVRKPLDHHFQVIGHGDLWNNNVLFQTDQTDPLVIADVKFIDFQNSMRTRPTMDLVHLFYQSTTPDLRKDHLNALLKLYHSELLLNLEMRGISPRVYPEEQFHQDFKNCFIHGLYMGFVNIQAIFNAEEVINKVVLEKENDPIGPSLTLKAKEVMLQRLTGLVKEAQEFEVIRFK
ncbi:hypothetical protein TCAL_14572 [Tigriopus californicus]|uniref:CHK kinase-like domain-containing protein n=2 Tax=Tigriopus californicus TaxID=6832 RepID=A0A553PD08_TIGCA|nr:hypothetical protein TCAL_14572 [Tigriopus californicus]